MDAMFKVKRMINEEYFEVGTLLKIDVNYRNLNEPYNASYGFIKKISETHIDLMYVNGEGTTKTIELSIDDLESEEIEVTKIKNKLIHGM